MSNNDKGTMTVAEKLRRLYNSARPQGYSWRHYDHAPMELEEAETILENRTGTYFDYLRGRIMKVDVSEPEDSRLYNQDNGPMAAETALDPETDIFRIFPEWGNNNIYYVVDHTTGLWFLLEEGEEDYSVHEQGVGNFSDRLKELIPEKYHM